LPAAWQSGTLSGEPPACIVGSAKYATSLKLPDGSEFTLAQIAEQATQASRLREFADYTGGVNLSGHTAGVDCSVPLNPFAFASIHIEEPTAGHLAIRNRP
jgi:hypothetical protein